MLGHDSIKFQESGGRNPGKKIGKRRDERGGGVTDCGSRSPVVINEIIALRERDRYRR